MYSMPGPRSALGTWPVDILRTLVNYKLDHSWRETHRLSVDLATRHTLKALSLTQLRRMLSRHIPDPPISVGPLTTSGDAPADNPAQGGIERANALKSVARNITNSYLSVSANLDKERLRIYADAQKQIKAAIAETPDDAHKWMETCRKIIADADRALGRGNRSPQITVVSQADEPPAITVIMPNQYTPEQLEEVARIERQLRSTIPAA